MGIPFAYLPERIGQVAFGWLALAFVVSGVVDIRFGSEKKRVRGFGALIGGVAIAVLAAVVDMNPSPCHGCGANRPWGGAIYVIALILWMAVLGYQLWKYVRKTPRE